MTKWKNANLTEPEEINFSFFARRRVQGLIHTAMYSDTSLLMLLTSAYMQGFHDCADVIAVKTGNKP